MGPDALEAIVNLVHAKFWGEAGEGTAFLRSAERPTDLLDVAHGVSTFLGDEVAKAMEAIHRSPGLMSELAALQEDWESGRLTWDEGLLVLKAALIAEGIL